MAGQSSLKDRSRGGAPRPHVFLPSLPRISGRSPRRSVMYDVDHKSYEATPGYCSALPGWESHGPTSKGQITVLGSLFFILSGNARWGQQSCRRASKQHQPSPSMSPCSTGTHAQRLNIKMCARHLSHARTAGRTAKHASAVGDPPGTVHVSKERNGPFAIQDLDATNVHAKGDYGFRAFYLKYVRFVRSLSTRVQISYNTFLPRTHPLPPQPLHLDRDPFMKESICVLLFRSGVRQDSLAEGRLLICV